MPALSCGAINNVIHWLRALGRTGLDRGSNRMIARRNHRRFERGNNRRINRRNNRRINRRHNRNVGHPILVHKCRHR